MPGQSGLAQQIKKHLPVLKNLPSSINIALAASVTTDGMQFEITLRDWRNQVITGVHALEFWISESASGQGLTADSASGALTAVSTYGAINTALTAKKHGMAVTNASGVFRGLIVDSANPVDQFIAVRMPHTGQVFVSGASGTSWEGV